MSDILVYALHYEGAFNPATRLVLCPRARDSHGALGGEAHAVVLGDGATEALCAQLGRYGAARVYRVAGPEGLAQPVVDAMAQLAGEHDFSYALFGGGLLGFEIGAGLAARLGAGVAMEVTAVRVAGRQAGGRAADPRRLRDLARDLRSDVGIVIGRLNAFEIAAPEGADAPPSRRSRSRSRSSRPGRGCSAAASSAARTSTSRALTC